MNYRVDETWHRLLQWTSSSAKSERLAAQILYDSGYSDVDPSHPLGGKDGGKDAKCQKDGKSWIMAVYFPRGQSNQAAILKKFNDDLEGVGRNSTDGIVFVTNQELRLSERDQLRNMAGTVDVEIFHLERIASVLDKPTMAGVRAQYLDIDFSNEELKAAIRTEIVSSESRITGYQTGGDSFCYWMLYHFDLTERIASDFVIIRKGDFPLYDVRIRIRDMDLEKDVFSRVWGEISSPAEFLQSKWKLAEKSYYRVFFHARNGQWHQDLQLSLSTKASCWLAATRVSDKKGNACFEYFDQNFLSEFGIPVWRM